MDHTDETLAHNVTADMREAVRGQILAGLRVSQDIAVALEFRHTSVVRILSRFEAVGALRLGPTDDQSGAVVIDGASLSERFQDQSIPLW